MFHSLDPSPNPNLSTEEGHRSKHLKVCVWSVLWRASWSTQTINQIKFLSEKQQLMIKIEAVFVWNGAWIAQV